MLYPLELRAHKSILFSWGSTSTARQQSGWQWLEICIARRHRLPTEAERELERRARVEGQLFQ